MNVLKDRIHNASPAELVEIFRPTGEKKQDMILFHLWERYFFPKYFFYKDAPFHLGMELDYWEVFNGVEKEIIHPGSRDIGKTTKPKLFLAYATLYELYDYGIVSSKELPSAKRFITEIYNMLNTKRIKAVYGEQFGTKKATDKKRDETRGSFETLNGRRLEARTVMQGARGQVDEEKRPDLRIYDDFENHNTLRSTADTQTIWDNIEEGIDGMNQGKKKVLYVCNYLSEAGNVHRIIKKPGVKVRIMPILDKHGNITWPDKYVQTTMEANERNKNRDKNSQYVSIEYLRSQSENFEQEYLCNPRKFGDGEFEQEYIDKCTIVKAPIEEYGLLKVWEQPVAGATYVLGADTSEGLGEDANTFAILRTDVFPHRYVAAYWSNRISPDDLGRAIVDWGKYYNTAFVVPELNNTGHATLAVLKENYPHHSLYKHKTDDKVKDPLRPSTFGWRTTGPSKAFLVGEFRRGLKDAGLVHYSAELKAEMESFTTLDTATTTKILPTRHFDLLTAAMLAWVGRNSRAAVIPMVV